MAMHEGTPIIRPLANGWLRHRPGEGSIKRYSKGRYADEAQYQRRNADRWSCLLSSREQRVMSWLIAHLVGDYVLRERLKRDKVLPFFANLCSGYAAAHTSMRTPLSSPCGLSWFLSVVDSISNSPPEFSTFCPRAGNLSFIAGRWAKGGELQPHRKRGAVRSQVPGSQFFFFTCSLSPWSHSPLPSFAPARSFPMKIV